LKARYVTATLAIAAIVLATEAGAAQAMPTTIGQLAPGSPPTASCFQGPSFDNLQPTVSSGNTYVVPPRGVRITSWSTNAAAGQGQMMTMKVLRLISGSTYEVVGHDGPRALTPGVINTFQTNIAVEPGDVLGNNDDNAATAPNACVFPAPDSNLTAEGDLGDRMSAEFFGEPNFRLNLTAVVTSLPGISSINAGSGSIEGGTSTLITGQDLTGASAVNFGSLRAAGFTVDSDGQITAIAPPSATPGAVDVSVTTALGTSPTVVADKFTYTACVVPKLEGKKLSAIELKLRKGDCKLGRLKGKPTRSAKVTKQSPKPGKVLAPQSRVNVSVG